MGVFVFLSVFQLLLLSSTVYAQVFFANISSSSYPDLSTACISILNQVVQCPPSIEWAGHGRFEDDATIAEVCTTTCSNAIQLWQRRVITACGSTRFNNGAGYLVLAQIFPEIVWEQYNIFCLQQGGKFCNAILRDLSGINPVDQSLTASSVPTLNCQDCFIAAMSLQQQLPLVSATYLASQFSSITSSCSKTMFALTSVATTTYSVIAGSIATTTIVIGPTSAPTPAACIGTAYTIVASDTCKTISKAKGISTAALLRTNNLPAFCSSFPVVGTRICISTADKCITWTVKAGDTCAKVADANSLTWTQMVSWNEELGIGCAKMADYVGYEICVSQPGGAWINPSPAPPSNTTSSWPTRTGIPLDQLPQATYVGGGNYSDWIWGEGTRRDCDRYTSGADLAPNNTCAQAAAGFNVAVADLLEWNPSLQNSTPCALDANIQYCAQRIQKVALNITDACIWTNFAVPGQTCDDFISDWGVSIDQFASWNLAVGSACGNFKTGYEYCVRVQHFKQPGMIPTCNKFTLANDTAFLDKPCEIIETKYGLTHGRFITWNPAVLTNCSNIYVGYDYCVSIPNFNPVYTARSSIAPYTGDTSVRVLGTATTTTSVLIKAASTSSKTGPTSIMATSSSVKAGSTSTKAATSTSKKA